MEYQKSAMTMETTESFADFKQKSEALGCLVEHSSEILIRLATKTRANGERVRDRK